MHSIARVAAVAALTVGTVVLTAGSSSAGSSSTGTKHASAAVHQPAPAVKSSDFGFEPLGRAPTDNDGLIPNLTTPAGSAVAPPQACSVTFASSSGATSTTINAWVSSNQDSITSTTVVCLSGTFNTPLHVWGKSSTALLEFAPAPGASATLDLGQAHAADTDPNQYWSDSGGISLVDSRSVEVYGLTIENYTYNGPGRSPAGIYVSVRSDTTNTSLAKTPHRSACFLGGGSCSDIYIIDNTISAITNTADSNHTTKADCNNSSVSAYGIAVIAAGAATSPALQHVVVEGNTVSDTRTGQSETVTFNGNVRDFLAANNTIHDTDNIALDTIGWETGASQASHAYITGNVIYNVDTESNSSYGRWSGTSCAPLAENAAALYDDGGSYIWFDSNIAWNTNQGINLDVETAHRETDHLLVTKNVVHDDPGTAFTDPSEGTNPPGLAGSSTVAGHDPYALYIDAFGTGSTISSVYVHDNFFYNTSQYFLSPRSGMPVVDLGGKWSKVEVWHNTITGGGATDLYNPLLEIDSLPSGGTATIDCNQYAALTTAASGSVNGNFALPSSDFLTLPAWQAGNKHGWDAHSADSSFAAACVAGSIQ